MIRNNFANAKKRALSRHHVLARGQNGQEGPKISLVTVDAFRYDGMVCSASPLLDEYRVFSAQTFYPSLLPHNSALFAEVGITLRMQVLGCSHHETALEIRERLAFSHDQTRSALECLRRTFPATETVLLSTCNRVELYAATANGASPTREQIAEFFGRIHRMDPSEILEHLFERTDREAVRHLFLVASSLDSMVVGEPQILSQRLAGRLGQAVPMEGLKPAKYCQWTLTKP